MHDPHEKQEGKGCMDFGQAFYGSVTVGERGQIVLGMEASDKLLVMKHPLYKGLMIFKIESVREFLDEFAAGIERVEQMSKENEE
jgi:hypothetical protein